MAAISALLSCDSHLEVAPELWTGRIPPRNREFAPRTIRLPDGGDALLVPGQQPRPITFMDHRAGHDAETWMPTAMTLRDTVGAGSAEQRLKEQDKDGIESEVLFPSEFKGPVLWRTIRDQDAYRATVRAYNDWLAEEYSALAPDRLVGIGVIPWTNLDDAIAELEHCARIGLRGVLLGALPSGKPHVARADDRFWRAVLDTKMALTVHSGLTRPSPKSVDTGDEPHRSERGLIGKLYGRTLAEWISIAGLSPAFDFARLILSGVFDRFPDLKFFFAETRVGWIPYWLSSADFLYERHRHWAERLIHFEPMKRRPSEYLREHFLFAVQPVDDVAIELRHHFAEGHLMFATDFPHVESEWPNTRHSAERLFAAVSEDEAFAIGARNMLSYFGLLDSPLGRRIEVRRRRSSGVPPKPETHA